jgi:hypothetical protein
VLRVKWLLARVCSAEEERLQLCVQFTGEYEIAYEPLPFKSLYTFCV